MKQWKLCTCDEFMRAVCKLKQLDDPAHNGPYWADIGMHPHWLSCGFAGEIPLRREVDEHGT